MSNDLMTAIYKTVNEHNLYFVNSFDTKDAVVNYISSNMF